MPHSGVDFIYEFKEAAKKAVSETPSKEEILLATEGVRFDVGKPRWDLMPGDALDAIAHVYTVGAAKYADRNWELGMDWGRVFGSLMRHSWKFWRGETYDEETGCHHMAMAAWNAIALLTYSLRGVGKDDRSSV